MLYSVFLSFAVTALQFGQIGFASAVPEAAELAERETAAQPKLVPFPFDERTAPALADALNVITLIPDEVLDAGDGPTHNWLAEHGYANSPNPKLARRQGWLAILKCVWEIGKFIAENGVPALKLSRVKKLIEALGGAKEAAKLLLKAKSWEELVAIAGPDLQALANEFLGWSGVAQECFSWI